MESNGVVRSRELDDAIDILISNENIEDEQNVPFAIISIGYDGSVTTFSPELHGVEHPSYGIVSFGNIRDHGLVEMTRTGLFSRMLSDVEAGKRACERQCSYFRWCGGGAPSNKLFENGTIASGETMNCLLTRKIILDEAQHVIRTASSNARQRVRDYE